MENYLISMAIFALGWASGFYYFRSKWKGEVMAHNIKMNYITLEIEVALAALRAKNWQSTHESLSRLGRCLNDNDLGD